MLSALSAASSLLRSLSDALSAELLSLCSLSLSQVCSLLSLSGVLSVMLSQVCSLLRSLSDALSAELLSLCSLCSLCHSLRCALCYALCYLSLLSLSGVLSVMLSVISLCYLSLLSLSVMISVMLSLRCSLCQSLSVTLSGVLSLSWAIIKRRTKTWCILYDDNMGPMPGRPFLLKILRHPTRLHCLFCHQPCYIT